MRYRRNDVAGATYFFTVNLLKRKQTLLTDRIDTLRACIKTVKKHHPFHIDTMVILLDHLHAIWTLPPGDADFAKRWMLIKAVDRPYSSIHRFIGKGIISSDWGVG